MKFSARFHYALAGLYDLAFHGRGRAAQAREIAARQGIPLRYLEQILQELRRAGLVEARRGPRGGYALARPAEAITLTDVWRALEDEAATTDNGAEQRPVTNLVLGELAARIEQLYAGVTVADIVGRAESLGVARAAASPQMYFI